MKRLSVLLSLGFIAAGSVRADMVVSVRGHDNGFYGALFSPGDSPWTWSPAAADLDGFERYGIETTGDLDFVWTHGFAESISGRRYLHPFDFSKSGDGNVWIDGTKATMRPASVPTDRTAPWIAHGNTLDPATHLGTLTHEYVTFASSAARDDAWTIDHAELAIEGKLAPRPTPGSTLFGPTGLGYGSYRPRDRTP